MVKNIIHSENLDFRGYSWECFSNYKVECNEKTNPLFIDCCYYSLYNQN